MVPNNSYPLFDVNVKDPYHFLLMLQTIMHVDVIDFYHFLSMLMSKMLVNVKIFDLNDPTHPEVLSKTILTMELIESVLQRGGKD